MNVELTAAQISLVTDVTFKAIASKKKTIAHLKRFRGNRIAINFLEHCLYELEAAHDAINFAQ